VRDADLSSPSSAVGHDRVELYLCSPYGLYGLYRASVPVQGCTVKTLHASYHYIYIYIYSGCPRRNLPGFGRVFLMLKYTDITQNTYDQS